jgi:hypothetical protein
MTATYKSHFMQLLCTSRLLRLNDQGPEAGDGIGSVGQLRAVDVAT